MINVKFINATSVQLVDQNGNTVSNVGEFISPTEFLLNANTFSQDAEHYYHFAITGSDVQLSGVIDSVTTKNQFSNLFAGCTAITVASALQLTATDMFESCYSNMFLDCTNLTTPPTSLPATGLAMWCYSGMFGNCSSLTAAPQLPATNLAPYCYYCMFYGCKSLKNSPTLPATTLTDWCYNSMFYNCLKLTSISANFSSWTPSNATSNWVKGIETVGEFNNENIDVIYGNDNIPSNWSSSILSLPLTFTAVDGDASIRLESHGTPESVTLQYKIDNESWINYSIGTTINLTNGHTVAFSGANDHFSKDTHTNYYTFEMTGKIKAKNNIQSLMNYSYDCADYCYYGLFAGESSLIIAPYLPATGIASGCYRNMFQGCSNLSSVQAVLPATSLLFSCYMSMFENCHNLSTAPVLPATEMVYDCYYRMFQGCLVLTSAPALPASTLADHCYYAMFWGCSGLLDAPQLPATTLAPSCYYWMFYKCTSLTSMNVSFTNWNATELSAATTTWHGGAASGVFYKPFALSTVYGLDYIPKNWRVVNK